MIFEEGKALCEEEYGSPTTGNSWKQEIEGLLNNFGLMRVSGYGPEDMQWKYDNDFDPEDYPKSSEKGKQTIEDSSSSEQKELGNGSDSKLEYDDPLSDDKWWEIDPEALKKFCYQMELSDGFDVDFVPNGVVGGPIIFKDLKEINKLDEESRQLAYDAAKLAINCYNNEHEMAKLEFVELVKFNVEIGPGNMFYLTFKAKVGDLPVSEYQAKVWRPLFEDEDETQVYFCREKPSSYDLSKQR